MLFAATVRTAPGQPLLGPLEGALVLDALQIPRRQGLARIHAFLVLADRVLLVLGVNDHAALAEAMSRWQRFAARQIAQLRGTHGALWDAPPTLEPLEDSLAVKRALEAIAELSVKSPMAPSSTTARHARLVDPLP